MSIFANSILRIALSSSSVNYERVLYINEDEVITINIHNKAALPITWSKQQLLEYLHTGDAEISMEDPFISRFRPDEEITPSHLEFRDTAWHVIAPLTRATPDIYYPLLRGALVSKQINSLRQQGLKVTKRSVYHYLRRYWQGGQVVNALLPHWDKSGGRGKRRHARNAKLGRPKTYNQEEPGTNVTDEILARLKQGFDRYITQQKARNLQEAYELTLQNFFSDFPSHRYPSKAQFLYWLKNTVDAITLTKFRMGNRGYLMRGRPLTGQAGEIAAGPGKPFMIDEALLDINLVSKHERQPVGRPTIVLVVDAFSWMITGVCVTLEAPSWMTAVTALENAVTNKVEYCQSLGINIEPEDWPSHHLPEWIYADRGVLKSNNSDFLIKSLNVAVSNNPPRRPDMKGVIERIIGLLQQFLTHHVPGAVTRKAESRLNETPSIDIDQLRTIVVQFILFHNKNFTLKKLPHHSGIVKNRVPLHPIDLWQWGMKNLSGALRPCPPEFLRGNLLPEASARVTEGGITYRNLTYICRTFQTEQWGLKAKRTGTWQISIRYNPSNPKFIYLKSKSTQVETASLVEHDLTLFGSMDWSDIDGYFRHLKTERIKASRSRHKSKTLTTASILQIVQQGPSRAHEPSPIPFASARLAERLRDKQQTLSIGSETAQPLPAIEESRLTEFETTPINLAATPLPKVDSLTLAKKAMEALESDE